MRHSMNLAAATATGHGHVSALIIVPIALIVAAGWAIDLYLRPYTSCGRCSGTGRRKGSTSRRYGHCPRCKGNPERLRFGARLLHRNLGARR